VLDRAVFWGSLPEKSMGQPAKWSAVQSEAGNADRLSASGGYQGPPAALGFGSGLMPGLRV